MVLFPNAKINLGLRVTHKRPDGFHNIESVFYPIPVQETLEFVESSNEKLELSGLPLPGNWQDNLIWRAYQYFKEKFEIPSLSIYLDKQIPMGAGMGGGSADLAFFIRGMNEKYALQLTTTQMESLASKWSSDAPFFIQNKCAFVTGKGEVLQEFDLSLQGKFITVVNPGIHISTPKAYGAVQPREAESWKSILKEDVPLWNGKILNDFEKPMLELFPELVDLKKNLDRLPFDFVQMSGSGSSFFGISNRELDVHELEEDYPFVMQFQLN